MLRLLTLISLLILSLATAGGVSASVTLGTTIAMTGSNSDVRFDVASALYAYTALPPQLDTTTMTFSGAFYGKNVGWIELTHVGLSCSQTLNALTSDCSLTGTGYNENIGDIDFSNVVYTPSTGLLSGSAKAKDMGTDSAGNYMLIDLSGIALPLRPITLTIPEIIASSDATLTVSGAWMHDGGKEGWKGNIILQGTTISREINGIHGVYTIDLSLAGTYEVIIIDSNGSMTTRIPLVINPDTISTTLVNNNYASTYCGSNTDIVNCPDGSPRSATTLTQEPPTGTMVADGVSKYTYTLKPRDQYGNRVTSGSMKIKYFTTVKNIQSDIADNMNYASIDGDAFMSTELGSGLAGSVEKSITIGASDPDIIYTISSTAPTNDDNEIKLSSIQYINSTINNNLTLGSSVPIFDPPYTVTVTSLPPVINQINTFSGVVTGAISGITPTIISTLQIGDGTKAEWHSLGSIPTATCTNIPSNYSSPIPSLCDWSGVSSIATMTRSDFTFTGRYTMNIGYTATPENTSVKTYIHYILNGKDILYNSQPSTLDESVNSTARVTILGGSSAGLGIGGQTRVDIINTLRERIFLLSRNRTNYDSADYTVVYGDYTPLKNNFFDTKRAIIVVGGDITITENIETRDHPLAIIALANGNNTGGNIIIADTVTDIHATLIAEHAIISTPTTNQLYIHGSLISANPPRDLAPSFCPFFVSGTCDPSDYDLPGKRGSTTPSIGGVSYSTSLVIESDPRLLSDPPPAMKK